MFRNLEEYNFNFFKKTTLSFIEILFFPLLLFSRTNDSLVYLNTNYYVASELFNHRIVMLGDYDHNQPGSYKLVYDVLDSWLKHCNTIDSTIELTYIIEMDQSSAEEINKFIITGDINPLVDLMLPDLYLENLEYFALLREFALKIDSVNQTRKSKISFNLKGFEEIGFTGFEKLAKLSEKQQDLWFVKERDSITAEAINQYMMLNPNKQILMFYGTAHLQNGYVSKNFGFSELTAPENMGFYLSHYLKKDFGDTNVVTFSTIYSYSNLINNPELYSLIGKDFITKPDNLKNPQWKDETFDYIFIRNTIHIVNISAAYVCSNNIQKKIVEKSFWIPDSTSPQYSRYLDDIFRITGMRFTNISTLISSLSMNKFSCTDWLYSDKFSDGFIESTINSHRISYVFSHYGLNWENDTIEAHLEKMKDHVFPDLIKQLRITNSIGIFWIGYPYEKEKAKEYLVKYTGQDFAKPEEYLEWYRKNILHVDY